MTRSAVSCRRLAVAKALLHAAKHPSCTISGFLLGSINASGSGAVTVTDVVPAFHISNHLATPVELALAQIILHTQQSGGAELVGLYFSDARYQGGSDLGAAVRKIADKVAQRQPGAVVLQLDNKKLASFVAGEDVQPFDVYSRDGSKAWKREAAADLTLTDSSWRSLHMDFTGMLKQRLHVLLHDFDDHLDDISKDWLNPELVTLGKLALPGQAL